VTVFNEPSEKDLLSRFASFIQGYNPHIITTYNGDKFDYPYIQRRMELNFLRFTAELGVSEQSG
jgi:DNA polymerase epsilon subunit 1